MATTVERRRTENLRQSNEWWTKELQLYERLDIPFDRVMDTGTPVLTREEVRLAAQRYMPEDVNIQQTVLPTKENIQKRKKRLATQSAIGETKNP